MRTLSSFIIFAKNRLRTEYKTYFFHHGNPGFILMSDRKQCKLNSMMSLKYPTVAASSSSKSPVNTSSRSKKSPAETSGSSKKEHNKTKKEEFEFFFGNTFIFSQFHPAKFSVDGITYSCMEQYMHHQKALTFNDTVRAYQILRETDPKCHKKLGRQVQPFDKVIWGRKCVAVVRKGSLAKYRQNLEMKKALFATYPKTLVEASPRDRLWGIGLGRNNPKAQDRSTWRGKNLLGDTLTEVRNKMMAEEELIPGSNTSGPSSIQRTPVEHDNKIQTLTTEEKLLQAKDVHVSSVPNKIVSTTKTSYKDDISSSKRNSSSEGIKKNTSDSIKTPRKEETLKSSHKSKESQHRESPLKDKYSDKYKTKSDGKEITIQESTSKNKSSSTKKRKWRSDDEKTESEDKGGRSSSKKRKIIFEEQKTRSEDKEHLMSKEKKGISGEQKTPTKHEEHSKERKERSRDKKTPSKCSGELTASQEMKETSREHKSSSKHSGKHSLSKEKEKSKEKKKSSKNEGELSVSMEKKKSREQAKLGEKERREISKDQQTSERDKREHSSSKKANRRTKEQETPSESMSVDDGKFLLTEKMKEEHDMNLVGSEEEHLSSDLNSVSKNEQQAPLKIEKVQSKEENLPASVEGQEVLKSEETLAEDDDNTSVKKTDEDIQSSSHKKPPEDKCLMLYEKMADSSDNKDIDLKEKEKSPLVPETTKEEMSMAVLSDQYSLIPGQSVDEENPVKNVNMDKPSEIKNTNSSLHAEENKACVSEDIPSVEGQSCLSRKRPVEEDSEYRDKLQSEDSSKTLKQRKITHFIIPKTVCSDNK